MDLKKMLLPSLFVFSSTAMAVTDADFNNLKKIVAIQQSEIALRWRYFSEK